MKHFLAVFLSLWAGAAFAHPGHLIEVAGHDHVLAGVAIGAAIAAGLWGALKGKPAAGQDTDEDDASDDAPQEA